LSKIIHVADIHLRLLKRHKEYKDVFDRFEKMLEKEKPDAIVVAGDIFHNKVTLSPEAFGLGKYFLNRIASIAPVHMIVGNHDCIVNQPGRMDALSPLLSGTTFANPVHLYKESGIYYDDASKVAFGVFAINDEENFPYEIKDRHEDYTYVALFHGALNNAQTDVHYTLKTKHTVKMFSEYHIAMLGDIHKQQYLSPRVAYSGSLIQQNFGESLDKGYMIWDTETGESKFVKVPNEYGYYTIRIKEKEFDRVGSIDISDAPKKPYVRLLVEGSSYNQVSLQNIASVFKEKLNPTSMSVEVDVASNAVDMDVKDLEIENVTQLSVQQKLIRSWFAESGLSDEDLDKLVTIHTELFNTSIDDESRNRGINWDVHRMSFTNTFSYGRDNNIDFDSLNGLVGIFAPNASGKSALLGTLLNGLFNSSDRVSRNNIADLINVNEDDASVEIHFTVDNRKLVLKRQIVRQKNDRSKAKTIIGFWEVIAGERIPLAGDASINETEKIIRSMLGFYEDHRLTTFGMQDDLTSFIDQNQSGRKEKLSRFLGLDIIDQLYLSIKAECDALKRLMKQYKEHDYNSIYKNYVDQREKLSDEISDAGILKERMIAQIQSINEKVAEYKQSLKDVDNNNFVKADILGSIEQIKLEIDTAKSEIEDGEGEVKWLQNDIEQSKKELRKYDPDTLTNNLRELSRAREQLSNIGNSIVMMRKDVKTAERAASTLQKHDWFEENELCKKCTFLSDAFKARDSVENILVQIDISEKQHIDVKKDIDKYAEAEKEYGRLEKLFNDVKSSDREMEITKLKLENLKQSIKHLRSELVIKKSELDQYNKDIKSIEFNKKVQIEIDTIASTLQTFDKQLSSVDNLINTKSVELGSLNQKTEDLGNSIAQLSEIEESFRLSSLLKEALSKDGIQINIIKKVIPRINMELRKILNNVTEFDVILEIDDKSDINIIIDDGHGRRALDLGSGMEKSTGSIALRAAIANVSLIPRCNLFIIDEGFGKLDSDNLNNMNMLLGYLKSIFKTVIIISHVAEMQDICDHIITMEKDEEGYSKLKIGE
jgi:DNA repair exonuclease SbcCD ATPase subunit/DNA repair exonuclease SbcCD nuclease subunit